MGVPAAARTLAGQLVKCHLVELRLHPPDLHVERLKNSIRWPMPKSSSAAFMSMMEPPKMTETEIVALVAQAWPALWTAFVSYSLAINRHLVGNPSWSSLWIGYDLACPGR
jgi:hypothetical protein